MRCQQIYPNEQLQKYVRYFWVLEDDSLHFAQKTFKIMSDGLPGLIFQEDKRSFLNRDSKELPQLFLYGRTTRYTDHKAVKNFCNIGVYFQPTALKSVFGIDSDELTNQHIDINDLIKTDITDQFSNAATSDQRIKLLSSFLIQQAERREIQSEKVNFAAEQLQKGVSLPDVQADLNISERSLERYFLNGMLAYLPNYTQE